MITGRDYAAEYVAKFGFIINELQQRLAAAAPLADTKDVFGRRIQVDNQ